MKVMSKYATPRAGITARKIIAAIAMLTVPIMPRTPMNVTHGLVPRKCSSEIGETCPPCENGEFTPNDGSGGG